MSWSDIPNWIKLLLSFILMGVGAWIAWRFTASLGFIVIMAGVAVLIVSGTNDSDKRGYKF